MTRTVGTTATPAARRLKVLLVVRWPVGGIRTYLKYVYGHLDPARYEIAIVAARSDETSPLVDDMRQHAPRYRELENSTTSSQWVRVLWSELRSWKPDIVHSHGFTAGLLSLAPARMLGVRHICTVHDVLHERAIGGWGGKARLAAMRLFLPMIDVVQTVGRDATDNLVQYLPRLRRDPGKVATIRNGIRSDQFASIVPRDLRAELGIEPGTFLIGFFGRFMSQKGFRYLVDALEQMVQQPTPGLRPAVIAFGGGGFVREERAALEKRGLLPYFHFLPFVNDVGPSLRGVDVVVVPSLWEACPLLPMEAMAAGAQVIGTNCIGLAEVLEDTPSIVVAAANAGALAEAVRSYAADAARGSRAMAFAAEARQRFDSRDTARSLESLLWNRTAAQPA
jgi:glycosyltransferase involved in cell wall biosynthesis